jgi:hypothetical protein
MTNDADRDIPFTENAEIDPAMTRDSCWTLTVVAARRGGRV